MKLKTAYLQILDGLKTITKTNFYDVENLALELEELEAMFSKLNETTEDKFFLKKALVWVIDMATATARTGHTFSSFPEDTARMLDAAYERVVNTRIDKSFTVCLSTEDEKLVERVLEEPTFKNPNKDKPRIMVVKD